MVAWYDYKSLNNIPLAVYIHNYRNPFFAGRRIFIRPILSEPWSSANVRVPAPLHSMGSRIPQLLACSVVVLDCFKNSIGDGYELKDPGPFLPSRPLSSELPKCNGSLQLEDKVPYRGVESRRGLECTCLQHIAICCCFSAMLDCGV